MAITDKEQGVWGLDQVYNKINQGSIWEYVGQRGTLFGVGRNHRGEIGNNTQGPGSQDGYSSPVQVPGTTWHSIANSGNGGGDHVGLAVKTDGTLWSWGYNERGQLGQNDRTYYSSPTQIGSGTDWTKDSKALRNSRSGFAIKTDGTLWSWGYGNQGALAQNNTTFYSSPVQIPGTTWSSIGGGSRHGAFAIKTDGTLWAWGNNTGGSAGYLGLNNHTTYSSPVQVGSDATWNIVACSDSSTYALKTDGTLWAWGNGYNGRLGQNQDGQSYSSPKQIGSLTNWIRIGTSSDTAHFLTHA